MISPCINTCTIDPHTRACAGCGRSLDEIARWTAMTDAERSRVMARLDADQGRRAARRVAAGSRT